ncbi:DUF6428 family protein [Mucilaginibacter sp. RS28]|uniref:DUF6428 family protein n=1 Tax=Mucilaginibacter straminoryzae TaxID=2932774 RepID=A0A9X1X5L3_9SPHI|nr:DUF6428 family protein [Mucilaginibacter straminoryzae]MCJ8209059.1 DUF6428 family protein [Mucilaginibacter straminoryzae]
MNNPITWGEFLQQLTDHPALDLQFQYEAGKWVKPSYHITEIKLAPITSVDCGGVVNKWTEVIVQLLEPENEQQLRAMKVRKALSIIDIVQKAVPLASDAVVKIEFGNSTFATRQMLPAAIHIHGENLVIDLQADAVQCKAETRGGSCGTGAETEACCVPAAKPKVALKNLATETACCTPGSGCC